MPKKITAAANPVATTPPSEPASVSYDSAALNNLFVPENLVRFAKRYVVHPVNIPLHSLGYGPQNAAGIVLHLVERCGLSRNASELEFLRACVENEIPLNEAGHRRLEHLENTPASEADGISAAGHLRTDAAKRGPLPTAGKPGQPGRPRIDGGWEVAMFQTELNILQDPKEEPVTCEAIFQRLEQGLVADVDELRQVRNRHKDSRCPTAALAFTKQYLTRLGFMAVGVSADLKEEAVSIAQDLTKQYRWRAYLEGGHRGDWHYLESALYRELAQQRRALDTRK